MSKQNIAFITGAASGIGLAIAKLFIQSGSLVIAADINKAKLDQHASELGKSYIPLFLDVGDSQQIAAAADNIKADYGKMDALINNAAIASIHQPESLESDLFDTEMAVNLKGPMLLVKHLAPLLRHSENGSVVNICSVAAICEAPGHYLYSAAKVALDKFSRDCAKEVLGIRHNSILPGIIDTPILESAYGKEAADLLRIDAAERCPVGRLGQPKDIANATLFLCSDKATFINGASLIVDGGITAAGNSPV